ncbi:MAG: hydrogenase small subunit, partial [Campylobacter sp.]
MVDLAQISARLDAVERLPRIKADESIQERLKSKGFSRRDFMKWSGAMTAMLGLPAAFAPSVARAAELADRLPVIWLHMAECTGCSESLLRTDTPSIDSLIFDYISLEYHETIMAAAGWQAEENLEGAIEKYKGRYILMVEGGIPSGENEFFLTVGPEGKSGAQHCKHAAEGAAAIFAIGTCSSFGGIQAAAPNPTGAVG